MVIGVGLPAAFEVMLSVSMRLLTTPSSQKLTFTVTESPAWSVHPGVPGGFTVNDVRFLKLPLVAQSMFVMSSSPPPSFPQFETVKLPCSHPQSMLSSGRLRIAGLGFVQMVASELLSRLQVALPTTPPLAGP